MANTKPVHPALIATAAALRAAGETWDAVAREVGRSASRVRQWPSLYPDEWGRHFRTTEALMLADIAVEARQVLRKLMRSQAERVALAAALPVLRARLAERLRESQAEAAATENDPELVAFLRVIRETSDEELNQWIEADDKARRSPDGT